MFLGREKEILLLKEKYNSGKFEFGIIHGRRRVGKTTLLKESIKDKKAIYFLARQANRETNLEIFSKIYAEYKNIGDIRYKSFEALLEELFKEKDLIVIIDEFTYLTTADPSLESLVQGLIDSKKEESNIKLIISGSEVRMFDNLFSQSKPLYGRNTFQIKVKECDYLESSLYYPNFSNIDKIRTYAIFGGLPYYLSKIDDSKSLEYNISNLIIEESSPFANEIEMILNTELRNIGEYQSILQAITSGSTKLSEIDSKAHIHSTDKTSKYISKLLALEIVEKELCFKEKPISKKHLYRIKNNFVAFYYQFIWCNLSARGFLDIKSFYDKFISNNLDKFISLRFEHICTQYLERRFLDRYHEIPKMVGRYWYNSKKEKKDIEIDICVETESNLHVYECKWTHGKIGKEVIIDLKSKGREIDATKYGVFSKSGYDENLTNLNCDLIRMDEFFF